LTPTALKPVPANWFKYKAQTRVKIPDGNTLTDIFLKQAARNPARIIIADQTSGAKSYRDIIIACLVMRPLIQKLDGDHVGIMLPASAGANIIYFATLFGGKIPVMVNWTAGVRNITASLDAVGVKNILTSKTLVDRIALQGIDLSAISSRFCFLEQFREKITRFNMLSALLKSYLSWSSLRNIKTDQTAVILFTSGSETLPKAVPLSHSNLISNMREVLSAVKLYENDRLIGFLPPFHSFGITVTTLLPLLAGVQAVYYPNPTEADALAKIIDAYKVTLFLGTPTFLAGVLRIATEKQLDSVRLAVTGAEKCPEAVYQALGQKCKKAIILEGYGVTECSPIISLNDENNPQHFSIGKILPSLELILIHPETQKPLTLPATGLLCVHGPSVFSGYLNYSGKSPFIEINGKQWYNTGDLVCVDQDGLMTFQGRLKRFIKLGGEMISLPAIESILEKAFPADSDKGPLLAVEAADVENPEIVLFTSLDIDREKANIQIRQAGLSGLHSIRRVIKLDPIPILGTGKTDYRALKQLLKT
jgi:long-chain-fatty-acid--[acyl-carrier-protein] ligase